MLNPPANLVKAADIEAYKTVEENKVFSQNSVERMLNLALPNGEKNADGQPREVNAFQELWDKKYISREITDALKEFRQFLKPLLPAKYAQNLETIENKSQKHNQKFALNTMQKYVTKQMAEKLKESFKVYPILKNAKNFSRTIFQPFTNNWSGHLLI